MVDGETKVVLITGCSSGIGHAAALLLSKDPDSRFKVYATMRNLAKKDELEKAGEGLIGKTLFIEKLDVSSEDEINTFVDNLLGKEKRIDILGECLIQFCYSWLFAFYNSISDSGRRLLIAYKSFFMASLQSWSDSVAGSLSHLHHHTLA